MKRYIRAAVDEYEGMDEGDRVAIARDPDISERVLREIFETDDSSIVRMALAYNTRTPSDILDKLANDDNETLVKFVVRNPNTSIETLDRIFKLGGDISDYAKHHILDEIKETKDHEFQAKCAKSKLPLIRGAVAQNPWTCEAVQNSLVNDSNYYVLLDLVNNTLIYKSCLEKLLRNEDDFISKIAWKRLNEEDYLEYENVR